MRHLRRTRPTAPRSAALWLAGLLGAALLLAGCAEAALERLGLAEAQPLTVAFVVHGTEEDPFWHEVRAGAESAAQVFDASVSWSASPDTEERVRMVDEALDQGFDVIVVTLSDHLGMERIVRDAVVRGAIVYVINAGVQYAIGFGAAAFFGMVETVSGLAAGERLAAAGVSNLLCVMHETNNEALTTRCEQAEFRIGEMIRLFVDPLDPNEIEARVYQALLQNSNINGIMSHDGWLIADPIDAALARISAEQGRTLPHAVYGVDEPVLQAIEAGRVLFAVDQQPWLQGYLPVAYAQLSRYSDRIRGDNLANVLVQWAQGGGIILGPGFIDQNNLNAVRESGAVGEDQWWLTDQTEEGGNGG